MQLSQSCVPHNTHNDQTYRGEIFGADENRLAMLDEDIDGSTCFASVLEREGAERTKTVRTRPAAP